MNCLERNYNFGSKLCQVAHERGAANWYETEKVYNVEGGFEAFKSHKVTDKAVSARVARTVATTLRKMADSLESVSEREMQVNRA